MGLTLRRRLGLGLTLVVFVATLPTVVDGSWDDARWNAGLHLFVLGWLTAATTLTRTLRPLAPVRWWFIGYFTVTLVVLAIGRPAVWWLGDDSTWRLALVVPLVEEVAKLLPVALVVAVAARRRVRPTLSDLVLVGAAVGAGFSFAEDLARSRVAADGFDASVLGALFPTFLRDYGFAVGHLGWTVVAAAGLGVVVLHRHRVWSLPLGLVLVGVAVADHARANLASTGDPGVLGDLLLDGRLVGWIVLGVVVGAIGRDVVVLRWATARDRRYPPVPARAALPLDGIGAWRRAGAYRRERTAVFADLVRLRSAGRSAGDRADQRRRLDRLRDAATVRAPAPPEPVAA